MKNNRNLVLLAIVAAIGVVALLTMATRQMQIRRAESPLVTEDKVVQITGSVSASFETATPTPASVEKDRQ